MCRYHTGPGCSGQLWTSQSGTPSREEAGRQNGYHRLEGQGVREGSWVVKAQGLALWQWLEMEEGEEPGG